MCPLDIVILLFSTIAAHVNRTNVTVLVNTFVPESNSYIFSRQYVEPAILYALENVGPGKRDLVPPWIELKYGYNDTKCSDIDTLVEGIEIYRHKGDKVLVFLGPVCDYAGVFLRLLSRYNDAVITPGAIHHYFGENKTNTSRPQYNTLVRIGATLNTLSFAVGRILSHNKLKHVRILIQQYSTFQEVIPKTCHHVNEAFTLYLEHIRKTTKWFHNDLLVVQSNHLPRNLTPSTIEDVLRTDVGSDFEGRIHILTLSRGQRLT
ncbi:hypothetical protein ACJMK2_026476 [Sinanodonta woodiana]|uniref:Receptor ligand binding region domain-containing protein n=1 Tax=Sinanodonta woodiana TaxID=1069815 RepID=A0ABD3XJQ5_SINWO